MVCGQPEHSQGVRTRHAQPRDPTQPLPYHLLDGLRACVSNKLHLLHKESPLRRAVCFFEEMSTHAAKEFADAVPLRFTASDYQSGLGPGALQSRLLVRRASNKPLRSTAFLRRGDFWSTAESMRSMLMEGCGGAPIARHLCSRWYRRASCRTGLRTPASVSSSSCVDTVLGSR